MGASGCPADAPPFNWHPDIFIADSRTQSVQGDRENISCKDPKFDQLVAIDKSEIAKAKQAYFDVVNECAQWKSSANPEQLFRAVDWVSELEDKVKAHEQK